MNTLYTRVLVRAPMFLKWDSDISPIFHYLNVENIWNCHEMDDTNAFRYDDASTDFRS